MKTITRRALEWMQRYHPTAIETAIWENWIATGQARIVENPENEGLKCNATV